MNRLDPFPASDHVATAQRVGCRRSSLRASPDLRPACGGDDSPLAPAPRGFALVSALVALAILLALLVPFLVSMTNESAIATDVVHEQQTMHSRDSGVALTLHQAAKTHPSQEFSVEGGTPDWDSRAEFPGRIAYPGAFKRKNDRYLRAASFEDLQRKIHLPTASPLVLANLLGLATSLAGDHEPDATTLTVLDATRFPEQRGSLLVYGERIDYQRREGNVFHELTRSRPPQKLPQDCLVLDYRVVAAVIHQVRSRTAYVPHSSVAAIQAIAEAGDGVGRFNRAEIDTLIDHCTTVGANEYSAQWSRPERVFNAQDPSASPVWYLRTKSAMPFGGGALVRIRSIRDPKQVDYNLVWTTQPSGTDRGQVDLQNRWQLNLLLPPGRAFQPMEAEVQALLPVAVNLNTADREVLIALLQNVRRGPTRNRSGDPKKDAADNRTQYGPVVDAKLAATMADELLAQREGRTEGEPSNGERPFQSWQDLAERFFFPRGEAAAKKMLDLWLLVTLQDNFLYGREPRAEMGTMPVTFSSNSLVRYRVGSMHTKLSGLETARSEVAGIASAMPGHGLDCLVFRQRDWEENTRLNRRAPYHLTFPINLGAVRSGDVATTPGLLSPALLYAKFFPGIGLGQPRYPSLDRGSARAATVVALPVIGRKAQQALRMRSPWSTESFEFGQHPDGRDLAKEGVFDMVNTGPRAGGTANKGRHAEASFEFTAADQGMPRRHAVSFWFKIKSLAAGTCIYDCAGQHPDRNRINLRFDANGLVFEVLDEAGLDPNPSEVLTQPARSAATWRVPLADANLKPNVWYHVNLSADGNRPGQLSLFVDGVPRKKPEFMTYLAEGFDVPEYKRPSSGVTPAQDTARYPQIKVESTDGFPDRGVLRIGRELFEYTSRDATTFYCKQLDSIGERKARMRWEEYRKDSDVDQYGRPNRDAEQIPGDPSNDRTPRIPSGSLVELYGYAASLFRNTTLAVGSTPLRDGVGAFSVARGMLKNPATIQLKGSTQTFSPGRGLDETDTQDIYLVDPVADVTGKGPPPLTQGDAKIPAGFPAGGGYALLVQWDGLGNGRSNNPTQNPQSQLLGGVELIRYAKRDGNKLTGIKRAAKIPGTDKMLQSGNNASYSTNGTGRIFVSEWSRFLLAQVGGKPTPFSELQNFVLYVVPVSLAVTNTAALNDPLETGVTEWMQIYPGKNREWDTEWVRYDVISPEGDVVRVRHSKWRNLLSRLSGFSNRGSLTLTGGTNGTLDQQIAKALEFTPPQDDGGQRIGYIDPIELTWGVVYAARTTLDFRGDNASGTTSHDFSSGSATVTPCLRLELDRGELGALSARCGRNDRVAMVYGTQASGSNRPPVEWHTINWYWQRHGFDNPPSGQNATASDSTREMLGPAPFQMVAFKDGVQKIFTGPASRQEAFDTRRVDRLVKFPSGELPAAYVEAAYFGGPAKSTSDYQQANGQVDECSSVGKYAEPVMVSQDVTADAQQIPTRHHTRLFSYGPVNSATDYTQTYPNEGGLLLIDGELIAYKSFADGVFQVAEQGRGLLGTKPRAHGDGARVHFVPQVPCAILNGQVSAVASKLPVQHLGSLPRYGGTVLMGQELLHYTWTSPSPASLGMPDWYDPEDAQSPGIGLFRNRYGTKAQGASSGSPVIWFPTRFWDRYHARSDDPELAYYQMTRRETPVFYRTVQWREDNPDQSVLKLHATANIDAAGSFADDPTKVAGMFTFEKGSVDGKPNRIHWQGSVFELRFATEYRTGAFDPVSFLANGWKQAITLHDIMLTYEGETRILSEQVTVR